MAQTRYNFIIPSDSGIPLQELRNGSVADFAHLYCHGEYCWSLQTYLMLKKSSVMCELSHALDPDAVNLAHCNLLRALKKRADCFCVSLQADFPHYPLAHYHIVQNRDQSAEDAAFIPLWPQIGQAERDSTREGVRFVAYQGELNFTDLDPVRLNADLEPHEIEFSILGAAEWHALRDVDVLVGIRSFGKKEYRRKPPSKLINAWHAGIPFIGGWDSAFSQIGTPGEDYIRVSSYEELLEGIIRLKENSDLYRCLLSAGKSRSAAFTFEAIAEQWITLFETRIVDSYETWKHMPARTIRFEIKRSGYSVKERMKKTLHQLYGIPMLKRLRDLYYDPVK